MCYHKDMQYKVKAIPTRYAGIQFRSRLEAKWASFFDGLGFTWLYEPLDFEYYTPDFLLPPDLFVEIKPITSFSPEAASRATRASEGKVPFLLLGLSPEEVEGYCHMGWAYHPGDGEWRDCYLTRGSDGKYGLGEWGDSVIPFSEIKGKWASATNSSQWNSPSRI
jgi:hypothetical protein